MKSDRPFEQRFAVSSRLNLETQPVETPDTVIAMIRKTLITRTPAIFHGRLKRGAIIGQQTDMIIDDSRRRDRDNGDRLKRVSTPVNQWTGCWNGLRTYGHG